MPSVSKKQHNLMALVANDPKAAKRLGISQKVGREFMKADKGHKFGSGGSMKESKAMMRKEVAFMKKKGAPKSMVRHEEEEMRGGRGKKVRRFDAGGISSSNPYEQELLEAVRHITAGQSGPTRGGPQYRWSQGSYQAGMKAPNVIKNPLPIGPKVLSDKRSQELKNLSPREAKMYDRVMREKERQMTRGYGGPPSETDPEVNRVVQYFTGSPTYWATPGGGKERVSTAILRQMRAKPKQTVEADPAVMTPEAAKSGVKAVPGAGGGGGAPPMAPRGMGPFTPMIGPSGGKASYKVTELTPEQLAEEEAKNKSGKYRGGKIQSHKASKGPFRHAADGVAHKGKTKGHVVKMREGGMAYSSGGSVFRRQADGIASKGKTKGKMVKMNYGGKC